jgi:hypothetical protein
MEKQLNPEAMYFLSKIIAHADEVKHQVVLLQFTADKLQHDLLEGRVKCDMLPQQFQPDKIYLIYGLLNSLTRPAGN